MFIKGEIANVRLCFKSPLSNEEIEEKFKDFDVFEGIKAGLEEALAYERGTASSETFARKNSEE